MNLRDSANGLAGLSILLVEDEPVLRQSLIAMLELFGCTVFAAANGKQAISCLRQHRIDVVLSDYSLPDIDGATLLRQIREIQDNVPIVVSSGHIIRMEHGAHVLPKPFNSEKLASAILQALKNDNAVGDSDPDVN